MSFSGYYYKISCKNVGHRFIIIVSYLSNKNESSALVQFNCIDNDGILIHSYTLSFKEFSIRNRCIYFGNSSASANHLYISEPQLSISITITAQQPIPQPSIGKSVMGIYHYVPFVQCKHYVDNIYLEVNAHIKCNNNVYLLNKALMYIENSKGKSFPDEYTWYHFDQFLECNDTYLLFACANPKWLFFKKKTHIGFLYHQGTYLSLGEINGSKLIKHSVMSNGTFIELKVKGAYIKMHIKNGFKKIELKGPSREGMNRIISEFINSSVEIEFIKNDIPLYIRGIKGTIENEIILTH
jgi:hypothetical protein